jgi:hypothetical protein
MIASPLRRLPRTQPLVSSANASKYAAIGQTPDQLGDIVQSLLLRFDDVLVKLDRIEAKIDLLPNAMRVTSCTDATKVQI